MRPPTLDRVLQSQGFGSRNYCRQLIETGEVSAGGVVLTDAACRPLLQNFRFTIFGEEWLYREHVYLAIHKPENIECSRKPSHHPGVLSLLPEQFTWRDVQPVGRLDHDTTGLLLMSDDGAFIHAQSSPKRHVPKYYRASTHDPVTPALIEKLRSGVQLHDEPAPLAASRCEMVDTNTIDIMLEQGKYHQVKRMLAAAGNHCTGLKRIAIGCLKLEALALKEGEWRYLEASELAMLRS
ncbi:MAG: pseudouridine synthase [Pseudomonadota bacterium]